eukprot:symbB.v1.2.026923.t1/scaffold2730.1/size72026/7
MIQRCLTVLCCTMVEATRDLQVMLSVITRNRFWTHALSSLSLLQSLRHAKDHAPQIHFEWHILDDATERWDLKKKNDMINDLVERKWVANYTRLDRHSGTVRALRHVVDTFLSRADLDLFFHCDDDILMGENTLSRAVLDYVTDLSKDFTHAGGVLALFVNSWLDEQLSVSTGSYATAPFLGGASYVVDRATLAQKNPWKEALQQGRSTPHEAHVFWLREMLPQQKLKIWIRWKKPYECQHLGNVKTLNFGTQPSWEPMWAIDHRSKRIVEVPRFPSRDVRTALLQRNALRDFVLYHNSLAKEQLSLPGVGNAWDAWKYQRRHFNYLEIGTSDFDTLLERHLWRGDIYGISVEPLRSYFELLPGGTGSSKVLLNVAISDHDGYENLYFVRPELVEAYMGSQNLCQQRELQQLGFERCLPGWMRGASSIKRLPEGVRQFLGEAMNSVIAKVQVPCMTYETLVTVYGVGSLDILKIDTEGFDHEILRQVVELGKARDFWPWQVQFEKNMLSDWKVLDEQVMYLHDAGYRCRMTGVEVATCWREAVEQKNERNCNCLDLESKYLIYQKAMI